MNIKQMEVFRAVMSAGSIAGAAQLLHVTSPGVSRMMKHLQLRLGVALFEKHGNRLVPTADAHRLQREIDRVYTGIEQVQRVADELKNGQSQTLRVICSPSLAAHVAPHVVAYMLRQYPSLQMHVEVQPVYDIYQALLTHQCDVAVSLVPIKHPNLQSQLISPVGMVAVLPAGHELARKKQLHLKDLVSIPVIRFPVQTTQGATLEKLLSERQLKVPDARITVKTARDACALAAEGVGAVVIDALTACHIDSERVTKRTLSIRTQYQMTALWSKDWPPGLLAREFIKRVQQGVQDSLASQTSLS
jgi:DNA-binding transcriptional LysR family regulator